MSVLPGVKNKVQTQGKRENGVLHTDVSLAVLDKRAQLGATGAQTKTLFGGDRYPQRGATCSWVDQWGQCVGGPGASQHPEHQN